MVAITALFDVVGAGAFAIGGVLAIRNYLEFELEDRLDAFEIIDAAGGAAVATDRGDRRRRD
ncbi:hypothetical protein [Halopiger aswanensis]|uniref:Uncharacterized protein n=1 Tax=Halopiger aswanensis TaxID=148449 RepID=A0A419WI09_9EURY|nr:hypothetical protein [Halopiger aswanensis]RKD95006.1 hypothetical protein ATJ93_1855 [Halopiger aswanensis]